MFAMPLLVPSEIWETISAQRSFLCNPLDCLY
jgi:hypothetical protein